MPEYFSTTLSNGAEVHLIDLPHAQTVQADLVFMGAGDNASPHNKAEVAHLSEHMAFKGCKAFPTENLLGDALEANGSYVNATTHPNCMQYSLMTPRSGWQLPLRALLQTTETPLFASNQIPPEREIVREELTGYLDNPWYLLEPAILAAAGRPVHTLADSLRTLNDITRHDLQEYHERTHGTNVLKAIVTANFDHISAETILRLFDGLELPQVEPAASGQPLQQPAEPVIIEKNRSTIAYYLQKLDLPPDANQNWAAFSLINNHLFSVPRSTIGRQSRDMGLTYDVSGGRSEEDSLHDSFYAWGKVRPENAKALWRLITDELCKGVDAIDRTAFERARLYALGSLELKMDNISGIHDGAVATIMRGRPIKRLSATIEALHRSTLDDFKSSWHGYLLGGVSVGAALGPEKAFSRGIVEELQNAQTALI